MTVRRIRKIYKKISPDIIFLMETKNPDGVVQKKLEFLHQYKSVLVSPQGHGGGGLALFWKHELELEVFSFSAYFY